MASVNGTTKARMSSWQSDCRDGVAFVLAWLDSKPETRLWDVGDLTPAWVYSRRSELAAAPLGTNAFDYAYDLIGNRLTATSNASTNTYSANNLNQYSTILRVSETPCERNLVYGADGNLTSDGSLSYFYDAENRLISVLPISPTNGSFAVENRYDHRHRRTQKIVSCFADGEWLLSATHTYVWGGNNIVLERIAFADGAERVSEYFWGLDLSGSEQGAGGIGGHLYLTVDGVIYIPCYDNNGNITRFLDVNGNTVAQYAYDAFGNTISKSGTLADFFRHRFSTKYFDGETGFYYYGYRFKGEGT